MIETDSSPIKLNASDLQKSMSTFIAQNLQLNRLKSQAQKTKEEGGIIAETFFGEIQSFIEYRTSQGEDKF